MKNQDYYIWSVEQSAWWGHAKHGYPEDIKNAGVYSDEESKEIVRDANAYIKGINELRFSVEYVDNLLRNLLGNQCKLYGYIYCIGVQHNNAKRKGDYRPE